MAEEKKSEFIGCAPCPLCASARARVSVSQKSQLAFLQCGSCRADIFTRGDLADEKLRALIVKAEPAPAPALAPAADPAPPPAPKPAPKAAPARDPFDVF